MRHFDFDPFTALGGNLLEGRQTGLDYDVTSLSAVNFNTGIAEAENADVILLICFAILYNFSVLPFLGWLLLTVFAGTLGLAVVGTLFAAVALNTRMSEVLLPILQLPITVPLMIACIEATDALIQPESGGHFLSWMQMLIAFDILFFVLCFWLFEYVIEE